MQLVAEYKIEFHGDEAVGVLGVVAAGLGGDNHGAFSIRVSASWAVLGSAPWETWRGHHVL